MKKLLLLLAVLLGTPLAQAGWVNGIWQEDPSDHAQQQQQQPVVSDSQEEDLALNDAKANAEKNKQLVAPLPSDTIELNKKGKKVSFDQGTVFEKIVLPRPRFTSQDLELFLDRDINHEVKTLWLQRISLATATTGLEISSDDYDRQLWAITQDILEDLPHIEKSELERIAQKMQIFNKSAEVLRAELEKLPAVSFVTHTDLKLSACQDIIISLGKEVQKRLQPIAGAQPAPWQVAYQALINHIHRIVLEKDQKGSATQAAQLFKQTINKFVTSIVLTDSAGVKTPDPSFVATRKTVAKKLSEKALYLTINEDGNRRLRKCNDVFDSWTLEFAEGRLYRIKD